MTGNGQWWGALAERLGNAHRIVAVDLRGRGQSDKPRVGSYGLTAHARDAAAVIQALGTGPVVAIGHSLGGGVAALLASGHPGLISHVVLVDAGGADDDLRLEDIQKQGRASLERLHSVYPSLEAYIGYWRQAAPYINPWTEHFGRFLAADAEVRPDGSVVSRTLGAAVMEDLLTATGSGLQNALLQLGVPTLIFWAPNGMLDPTRPLFSRESMERLLELLPNGRMVTVEGANHMSICFSPDCVDQMAIAIQSFLRPKQSI